MINQRKIFRILLFGLAIAHIPSFAAADNPFNYLFGSSENWKEEVQLHDGRVIVVDRHVNYSARSIDVGRQELNESLTFTLPNSNSEVVWKSDFNRFSDDPYGLLSILLLDIVNDTPYIATRPANCFGFNKWKRLNPPYILFKYYGNKWNRISIDEFPEVLAKTNVIVGSPPTDLLKSFYNVEQVSEQNRRIQSKGYNNIIRKPFPIEETRCMDLARTKAGWESSEGDKVVLPPPQDVQLEVLESKNYNPDRVIDQEEWGKISFDQNQETRCNVLFKPVDPNDPMKVGKLFAQDQTGQKLVPYVSFHNGARRLCDQSHIWFFTHQEQPHYMIVTQYSTTGDLIYRVRFQNPEEIIGFTGFPVFPTIHSKDGYLYFDWWHFKNVFTDWHVARTLKVRFREPVSTRKD